MNFIMKKIFGFLLATMVFTQSQAYTMSREMDFNFDWKFTLLDKTSLPTSIPLDDEHWRDIRLPHDWSVESSFDKTLEGATGYLPGGVGIYQKHFYVDKQAQDKSTFVLFDGVYNNATFWLNGQLLGENPYGYSPVYFDLSKHLKSDGSANVLTVHVDHSRYVDSRWYTGSGIYRHVKLITVNKLHIPIWGTFITTPEVSAEKAKINLSVNVSNKFKKSKSLIVSTNIIDRDGNLVASAKDKIKISKQAEKILAQTFVVSQPQLWDFDNPTMYKAITTLKQSGKILDQYETPFGIRSIKFEARKGFFLNGKSTLMKGVSLHHDGGLVGSAVPKGVWKRRLQSLKVAGVNAIRTAHNPYSQEFLDLCDEMGFLVQNEFFDEFDYAKDKRLNYHERHDDETSKGYVEHFQKWAKSDLTRTMLRDRNHPSIVQWSIGNEIEWTYLHYRYVTGFWEDPNDPQNSGKYWGSAPIFSPQELEKRFEDSKKGDYILAETAQKVSDWVKELDTTRPTTTNMIVPQVSHVSGYADTVDIVGYSYRNVTIPWAQTHFPDKHITINENPGTWDDWKHVLENPGVFSIFMWTGIDYMGERHQKWPEKSGWGDILDLAGFKQQGWNYFKSIWVNEPHLSIGTLPLDKSGFKVDKLSGLAVASNKGSYNWRNSNSHWNYSKDNSILVEIATNHTMVELFINDRSLGYRSMSESPDRLLRWVVPFEAGTLTAKAGFKGQEIIAQIETTSKAVGFSLTTDKATLSADGYDVAHLVVQLHDKTGREVKTSNAKVFFEIQGDVRLLGVDNGAPGNIQDFQSNNLNTSKGRGLAIIQSNRSAGVVKVTAKIKGFEAQTVFIKVK